MDDNIITKIASVPLINKIEAAEEYLHLKKQWAFWCEGIGMRPESAANTNLLICC